jgi:CubicO group peptidase (beta-lactamase class C family)
MGADPKLFPRVSIGFVTVGHDLVPVTQDLIHSQRDRPGGSYWDIIVQPGQVWSESSDGAWSRAAFPFALVNTQEGDTHNGLAMFSYRAGRVSNLQFQIVQQTAPYDVPMKFTASGSIPAALMPIDPSTERSVIAEYRASLKDEVPVGTWDDLLKRVGSLSVGGFGEDLPAKDTVVGALDYDGVLYLHSCNTPNGPLPWCNRARFGVWSVTKSLVTYTALLRLAEKYGPSVFYLKISDYVSAAAAYPDWFGVTFEDAIDMATGLATGNSSETLAGPFDDDLDPSYTSWYEARTRADKLALLTATSHRVQPLAGQVMRYRDQDTFILSVAIDRFIKSKEGKDASLWRMLRNEVFGPIGIHYAPTSHTAEASDSEITPLAAYGYYPTLGDIVKIARLYHNEGRANNTQILYAPRIAELMDGTVPLGLPTGLHTAAGDVRYFNSFWQLVADIPGGCHCYYPQMEGWGGNIVALFSGGLTGIRIANVTTDSDGSASGSSTMAAVANQLVSFCRH